MSHRETRPFWKRLAATTLVVLPVLLVCLPAFAESHQTKERIARKACLDGDYNKGVAILSDLFLATMNPTYIFNQGRCYEQNGRYESAIARFEEYLRSTNLTPDARASSEKHLDDCRKNLAKERESLAPPAVVAPPPGGAGPVTRTEPEPRPGAISETPGLASTETTPPTPVAPSQRRWGLITGGIVAASLGVGTVVGGLLFHMKANSMANDWESKPGSYSSSKEDEQKTYRTLAGVSYGVGAAMVAAGTVLIIVGAKSRAPASNNLAIAPTFGPGLAGAVLTGAF